MHRLDTTTMRPLLRRFCARVAGFALRGGLALVTATAIGAGAAAQTAGSASVQPAKPKIQPIATAAGPAAIPPRQGGPPPADGWTSVHVPGRAAALLAAAGLDAGRPRTTAMLDIIRVVYEVSEGVDRSADERRARFLGYLEAISEFERIRTALRGAPVRLALAENKDTRRQLEDMAEILGASLEREDRVYRLQPRSGEREQQRRVWLLAAGFDVAKAEAALNGGAPLTLNLPGDDVPLPLPDAFWRAVAAPAERLGGTLVTSILGDRKASLLYYGLCSLDLSTRQFIAANDDVVKDLYNSDRPGVFALYGRSLRVSGGRVEPPGGPPAVPLWEAVVDERVTRPERFVLKVLGNDGGRLALLYDAVAHLSPPARAFALGLWMADPKQRTDRFKRLHSASADLMSGWDPIARPFARGLYDGAQLLLLTRVTPDGRAAPPVWRTLWEKILDGDALPDKPENELKNIEKDGVVDAAWLVDTLLLQNLRLRRSRAEAWLFAQRVFGGAPDTSLPQVLVAMRGYSRFRTLADTLERLGITDPLVYIGAFRQAQRVAVIGDRERGRTALALYQGGLVLIERARISRVLDAGAAGRLVVSLGQVPISEDGDFLGGIASWIDAAYLPAIGRAVVPPAGADQSSSLEAEVIGALAGRRPGRPAAAAGPTFEYEGVQYRIDPARPEVARMQAIRNKQGGPSLDAVMGFSREVLAIAAGIGTLAQVPGHVTALKSAAAPLVQAPAAGAAADPEAADLAEAVNDAVDALGKIRKAKDLNKAERIAVPLRRRIDTQLAGVLMSVAYACNIGDPESTALVAGDPSRQHDWGLLESDEGNRVRAAWRIADETRDERNRWRVTGSILALDAGLSEQSLRRISSDAPPDPPTITDNDRQAFTEAVVFANTFDYRDQDMAVIADAIRRGRARVAVLASVPDLLPEVAEAASLDEARTHLLAWALVQERDRVPDFFSLGELLRLGQLAPGTVVSLDAWGTSGLSREGSLCLRYPDSQPWSTFSGRRGKGLTPTFVPDLALLVAETLSDHRLPAALTRSMLAVATQDYLDRVRPAFEDDWMAMVAAVQRIVAARMDDYLASVMTAGPLVPVEKGGEGGRQH
jgi:hypothetical protein